jgi:serine/threonine protein kinase
MPEQRLSERSIFEAAIDKGSPAERAAFLDQACGSDAGLRREVEALLEAHDRLGTISPPGPAANLGATVDDPTREGPGRLIGPYKLLEQIGEGGFGVVFLADQTQPVRRKVALKVLKPGMDTRQVVARFEAERQALALMDHPNIAKVFDGGATPSGRPYFVMELVRGVAVTEFCDRNHQTPRERLELFVSVCQAVQHAHQKGFIHRDLEPSNVLVSLHDTTPVVKVIDFGVAKASPWSTARPAGSSPRRRFLLVGAVRQREGTAHRFQSFAAAAVCPCNLWGRFGSFPFVDRASLPRWIVPP